MHKRALTSLAAIAVLGLGLAGCGDDSSAGSAAGTPSTTPSVGSSPAVGTTTEAAADLCPGGKIEFGVEPYEDASKLTPAYQKLGDALSKALDCPVDVQIVESYTAEILAMQNGKLQIGQFGPLGFVFASQRAGAVPVASFGLGDGTLSSYTAGIWVPKDSSIMKVEDLKGHTLALSEAGSTSGDALPREEMITAGLKDGDVDVTYAGGHAQSMLALTHGKVDAAEVNSQQQASATASGDFDASKYREIWTSAPIPNDPVTVAGSTSPAFQKAVSDTLLNLPADDLNDICGYLDVDPCGPMIAVTKDTYQPLFDLAADLGLTEKDL